MRFRLLGNLEVRTSDNAAVALTRTRHRQVLANLLLTPNLVTSTDLLIDGVWGERPPRSARGNLKSYMCELRKTLEPLCVSIETIGNGYRIVVERHDVDSAVFEDLVAKAAVAFDDDDLSAVVRHLRHGLSMWRGEALHDLAASSDRISAAATRLNDKRLTAVEMLAAACIRTGQNHMAIEYVRAAIAQDPLHERLWGHLMLALYRVGRRADALATYQQLRTLVIDNLGVNPCREVAELHQRILAEDPDLTYDGDRQPRAMPAVHYAIRTAG